MSAYATLERRHKRLSDLGNAAGILHWDQAVVMPKGANPGRGEQLASLSGVMHDLATAPEVADLLDRAEEEGLDGWRRANLALMRRDHTRATALPGDLVEADARATNASEMAWRAARAENDFKGYLPHLTEVVRLAAERAAALGERLSLKPYDALLDGFQIGLRDATVERLLTPLERELPPRIERILGHQGPAVRPMGPFPVEKQRSLATELMRRMGFDFERGRLDESAHPFSGGADGDVRITTRYDEAEVASGLMAVLHETGHALYEANRPADWLAQPVGAAQGMAAHESQSLIVEMQACRSAPFLRFLSPLLQDRFGPDPAFTEEGLIALYHRVERGLIRVDADEVSYPLHVVLRHRLERALIRGDLAPADLPGAWNDAMHDLLGITPPNDRLGCLQDIHWPSGAFGYFPSYTLGALLAAQLFQAALEADPGIPDALGRGDFAGLLGWLRRHVHEQGGYLGFDGLVEAATGKPLGSEAFLAHLDRRYLALYNT